MSTATATHTLRDRGTDLRVETWVEPGQGDARRRSVPYVGGTILAILGVSALLKALFGGLLPTIDLGPLLDRLFGWIPGVEAGWLKYVVGFLVAVSIAVREAKRRKSLAQRTPTDPQDPK